MPAVSRRSPLAAPGTSSAADAIHSGISPSPDFRRDRRPFARPRVASGRPAETFGREKETFRALDRADMDDASRDLGTRARIAERQEAL